MSRLRVHWAEAAAIRLREAPELASVYVGGKGANLASGARNITCTMTARTHSHA